MDGCRGSDGVPTYPEKSQVTIGCLRNSGTYTSPVRSVLHCVKYVEKKCCPNYL